MPQQSLFKASKQIFRFGASGIEAVGEVNIGFELYTQSDIDANVEAIASGMASGCTFGDSDQSKVVLVAGAEINVPSGFKLTPANPKKSLVILCNKLINNGEISMTGKGPNVDPHDYLLLSKFDYYGSENAILVPAYANNAVARAKRTGGNGANGNNGTNRNCGSGGQGSTQSGGADYALGASGSGSAFAGGAGSGGVSKSGSSVDVNTTYPMRGGNSGGGHYSAGGGVGNPVGANGGSGTGGSHNISNNSGVGGRLIIFCSEFINNGTVSANGVATKQTADMSKYPNTDQSWGGASGAGAIDLFYYTLTTEGTLNANGGANFTRNTTPGKGGNGSITLLNWDIEKVVKPQKKYMSRDNMIYFLQGLVNRINGDEP